MSTQKKVLMYSTSFCPYCIRAKNYFVEENLSFEEINLTGKFSEIEKLKNQTSHRTFPQIFVGEEFVGGYSDMMEKIESGNLKFY